MSAERLQQMRDHSGVNPVAIVHGDVPANRADRRLAARAVREAEKRQASIHSRPEGDDRWLSPRDK